MIKNKCPYLLTFTNRKRAHHRMDEYLKQIHQPTISLDVLDKEFFRKFVPFLKKCTIKTYFDKDKKSTL
ncbi:hypothetical protein [Bacteroides sp.]|uniref:hypothetical protein n=1 Tax=Bacteroides sp. TaxID=29523 RepID=UPI0026233CFB|nr:hypothetical protein [Bacteroides sp.]MDD3037530.1 hypothetical protein [Bacteroides sp.]